jgi:exodeoxyribonuclease V alpha subunit
MSSKVAEMETQVGLSGWLGVQRQDAVTGYLAALAAACEPAALASVEVEAGAEEQEQGAPSELSEQTSFQRVKEVWLLAVAACSAMGVRDPRMVHVVAEVMAAPTRGSTAVLLSELTARVGAVGSPTGAWRSIDEASLRGLLRESGMVDEVLKGDTRPLLLVHDKLVSRSLYVAHGKVRTRWQLPGRLALFEKGKIDDTVENSLSQSEAVKRVAAGHRNIIVTGGPGTGKTTTIGRIVNLCVLNEKRVELAAPTGRAQARMFQALLEQANAKAANPAEKAMFKGTTSEEVSPEFRDALLNGTVKPSTIHRLLGIHGGVTAGGGAKPPIAADVVIIDEASMVDLTLMARLVERLPPHAQLVLVGDPHQLASVEAGSVLGDLITAQQAADATEAEAAVEASQTIKLEFVFRTAPDSKIRDLAEVSLGISTERRDEMLFPTVATAMAASPTEHDAVVVQEKFTALKESDWKLIAEPFRKLEADAEELADGTGFDEAVAGLLDKGLNAARVLCLHRGGKFGSVKANEEIGGALSGKGDSWSAKEPRVGAPVMATQNNNLLGIFNGDLGLCVRRNGAKVFAFERAVASDGSGAGVNYVSPAQVPGWQPAYATTVHKAQGSQAEHVVVMLPDVISRLCTREGLYTGITRAKSVVRVIGPREVFDACVARVTERTSLLPEMLRG